MGPELIVTIGADHPSLAGHFPGHPVVPGVVMLGEIMNAIREMAKENIVFVGMPSAKFISPLNPGEPLTIRLETGQRSSHAPPGLDSLRAAACAIASSPMIPRVIRECGVVAPA